MPECSKCEQRIRTGSLCDVCRVERNHAGVEPDRDVEPRCGVCGDAAPEGDYAGDRAGIWMCDPCQVLALTPPQRAQLVAETPDALGGAVRWAIGDANAYPDQDPATLEAGFETAGQRLVADGGKVPWSDRAPQYMKDGELYSSVQFDDNGDPRRVSVAQNQGRRGEFDIEGSTAVYDPNNVVGMPQAGAEIKEYVESLPFVNEVEMGRGEA